jgi:signal transduction histidine kinase
MESPRNDSELEKLNATIADLERFIFTSAHDLKEPVRMISTYLGVFLREYPDLLDDRAKKYLEYVRQGSQRLSEFADSWLQYGRLSFQQPERLALDFEEVAHRALQKLTPIAAAKEADIEILPLPTLLADPKQMELLFWHLLSNALKFSAVGRPPKIHLSSEEGETSATLTVKDDGIGMSLSDPSKLFQPFQRFHSRTEYPGSGMGLAICKRIVDLHHGRIEIESSPTTGTTVRMTFPRITPLA